MQSQQKRVKWSRGETAEALEERTDTGITSASVELMENCIPDIYGNISRRPALKLVPNGNFSQISGFEYDEYLQVFPFYITEDDYILVGIHYNDKPEFIRIKDGVAVWFWYHQGSNYPKTSVEVSSGQYAYRPVSFAQQDNYMVIADGYAVYKLSFDFTSLLSPYEFDSDIDIWKFSAGWYAPNGTSTRKVTSIDIPGLNFQSNQIGSDVYTESDGSTVVYSWIKTGISAASINGKWTAASTWYYFWYDNNTLETFITSTVPSLSASTIITSWQMQNETIYTNEQNIVSNVLYKVQIFIASGNCYFVAYTKNADSWDARANLSITENILVSATGIDPDTIPVGSIVHFPNSGGYMRVEGFDSDGADLRMYGEFLTPIADANASDTTVNVEYGYVSLQPTNWSSLPLNAHPLKLVFHDQRLWAGSWASSLTQQYAITIGSQIARYNDFKNNYNQENEPITLDILTQYKEKILHLVDYNGLKIMTDSYEYAYQDGGAVKQSANGSFEYCEPIMFDSLCMYIDGTGQQVKAMQYEFQSNIFNSSTINQVAPHDLVWYPWAMATYEDKENSTGKYLFLINRKDGNTRISVCNFVPSNQANIWSRWSLSTQILISSAQTHIVHSAINLKNGVIFMVVLPRASAIGQAPSSNKIVPTVLDFNASTDFENAIFTKDGIDYVVNWTRPSGTGSCLTFANTQVAVYADGVFQWLDTTTSTGALTKSIAGLTNVTAGLPINSTIRSHPIDVGGKTKAIKKRIGKARMSVHGTDAGVLTINGKTGYMNPAKDEISFYGVTGMKNEIKYTITNNNGGMFHLESLLMNIEYGTLDS